MNTRHYFLVSMLLILSASCFREAKIDKSRLLGDDYRLFQDTPAWELAKAVQDEDIKKIKYFVEEKKVPVDFKEERFGQTLLQLAVNNQQIKSVKTLLDLGADPNSHDSYDGSSPIIDAAGRTGRTSNDDPSALILLLQYGGNPNDEEVGERKKGNFGRMTPLSQAVVYSLEKVKLLVEAGADVNHTNEYRISGPMGTAITFDHMDIVLYLLEHGAYFDIPISMIEGKLYYICDDLQFCRYPLGSKQHKDKMKVYEFLKERGIDCRNNPMPEHLLKIIKKEHPNDWKEYIEKY